MKRSEKCEITNTTKGRTPDLPFVDIKEKVLGKRYELSLVFIADRRSAQLNFAYRKKNTPTNILSFPLTDSVGEIFINLRQAKREALDHNYRFEDYIGYLFIHGLLHLKGFKHGSTMEQKEKKFCRAFGFIV